MAIIAKPGKCKICGADYIKHSNSSLYCSADCKHKALLKLAAERRKKTAAIREKKKSVKTLREINEAARKRGLTYGRYMALVNEGLLKVGE